MAEKLLEKSRNLFLSLTPPENLIPKKRVKASKKSRYQSRRTSNSGTSYNKFFHEKNKGNQLGNIHISSACKMPFLKNLSLENINIIPPIDHSAVDKIHFAIGGNINQFLKTEALHEKKNNEYARLARKNSLQIQLTCLETQASAEPQLRYVNPPKNSVDSYNPEGFISPFYLKWNKENIFLDDFIKGQLRENAWNSLFSSYDLNYVYNSGFSNYRFPIRIKNQHKNELMEYRKLAIFYGNLSRNYLTFLMQTSGESKFLSTLERRLDVVLKRSLFFPTIWAARQWIHQGKILVNYEICSYNSYLLQPGDLISIKEEYKNAWKKEWFKNKARDSNVAVSSPTQTTFGKIGRFLFSSHIMRKWDKWCQLWARSISRRKDGHLWSKLDYNLSKKPVFNNSVSADNLYLESFMQLKNKVFELKYTHREPTPILLWLEKLYRNSPYRKKKIHGRHYMYQLISSLLLLQQRGPTMDGLFQQRWNRLFTKKKPKTLKRIQWGGIKPMHLECSYSCATMIYLFTPQKLVWPSHINVLLLKSALNG